MTVNDWLNTNHEFTEATMMDANGNEVGIFINDEPYNANIIRVEAKSPDVAVIYTDWKGE